MEAVLLQSVTTPPTRPKEPFLPSSGSCISFGVDLAVKSVPQMNSNLRLKEDYAGRIQKNHDKGFDSSYHVEESVLKVCSNSNESCWRSPGIYVNNRAFDRMVDEQEAVLKVDESMDQQGWDEVVLPLENELDQGRSVSPDDILYLLRHCDDTDGGLPRCHQVHKYIISSGHGCNVFLHNNLVEKYSKCGSLTASCVVFSSMIECNVFSWTAIILAHVNHDQAETAVVLFGEMFKTGILPDKVLFNVILKAGANLTSPEKGREVHAYVIEYGFECDSHVGSTLIFMHVELGSLHYAQTVFNKLREPCVVAWNTLIMGYAEDGLSREALTLFKAMQEVTTPDDVTFLSVLKACMSPEHLNDGMDVHAHAIENGLDLHLFVGSSLGDMYAKCGGIEHAYVLFNKLEARNVVSWTTMITGYAQQGMWDLSLNLFKEMQSKGGAQPNELTYASALCACSGLHLEEKGRAMHADIVMCGYELDIFIASTLIDMYANCGFLDDASFTFVKFPSPNLVAYNSMLSGYVQHGLGEKALTLFQKMVREGLTPDEATFVSVLKACSFMEALEEGKEVHLHIVRDGVESDDVVASSLVTFYSRCGLMEDSLVVFENMPHKDIGSWNALIAGYSLHAPREMALSLFERMQKGGCEPNKVTYVSVFKSCAGLAALDQGRRVFMHMVKNGIGPDLLLDSTLVDFFAKSGSLEDGAYVFMKMREHDVVSYTAMITAYAQQGRAEEAISLYECMTQEGVQPNEVTFVGVLNACNHAGLVHEALQYLTLMRSVYGITPTASHCACIVDLLGRAGHHVEAVDLLSHLRADSNEIPWLALLVSCRSSHTAEVAKKSADHILDSQGSRNAAAYVLLSNISAE